MKSMHQIFFYFFFQKERKINMVHLAYNGCTLPLLTELSSQLLPLVVLEKLPVLLWVLQTEEEQNPILILKAVLHILLKTGFINHHCESHGRIIEASILCEQL